ncbi:hypothetical protein FKO01_13300 [Mesorhizobium sp. B2-3-3]|nr:hypothetical protein FKO01_13300 [Mesorhizobium sp. B2-3-3]
MILSQPEVGEAKIDPDFQDHALVESDDHGRKDASHTRPGMIILLLLGFYALPSRQLCKRL